MAVADWTVTAVTDIILSGMTFGCDWMFTYREHVHRRSVIQANEVKYNWKIVLCCYEHSHV